MKTSAIRLCVFGALLVLAACGNDSPTSAIDKTSTARGTLIENPPFRIASLDAAAFGAELSASAFAPLLGLTGPPACGVDFNYMHYWTVGGTDEPENASGALMVPTGAAPQCSGARPILLYAHGTQVDKTLNIADPTNPNNQEGILIAAMFAAHGYIVVAPNYVGYDTSTAPYHPYLNEIAESKDMIDALTAARNALPNVLANATTDNGLLFITGYSQGGHVAMATHKAMQALGMPVKAAGPMSGPYALEAFGDAAFTGSVGIYSTLFYPMLATSYQKTYGNVYGSTSDFYEDAYAPTIEGLLPSAIPVDQLIAMNQIPLALFNVVPPTIPAGPLKATLDFLLAVPANPLFSAGFGTGNLVKNDVRVGYVTDAVLNPDHAFPPFSDLSPATAPAYGLRQDLDANDLRDWIPEAPVLLCGGGKDPVVFFSINTGVMSGWWQTQGVPVAHTAIEMPVSLVAVLDLETGLGPGDPFADAEIHFQGTIAKIEDDASAAWLAEHHGDTAGALEAKNSAYAQNYHQTVEPFCQAAVRGYFGSLQGQ